MRHFYSLVTTNASYAALYSINASIRVFYILQLMILNKYKILNGGIVILPQRFGFFVHCCNALAAMRAGRLINTLLWGKCKMFAMSFLTGLS